MLTSNAIQPGTDINPNLVVYQTLICERCGWKYAASFGKSDAKVAEWCSECNGNLLFDRSEDLWWEHRTNTAHVFMGWRFEIRKNAHIGGEDMTFIRLMKRLIHPEAPDKVISVSWFPCDGFEIGDKNYHNKIVWSCAWLIAHWWEHALDICPCQHGVHDDEKGSTFRQYVIDSLLWYHAQGLS